ncbi:hypothetical protein [Sphingomonas sp. PWP1-2]|uniref:hypothetical protein n=1 Tax=Sphingomonas sp. PWP1-2 TaxID=2804558 RepID=UPI003CFA6DFD
MNIVTNYANFISEIFRRLDAISLSLVEVRDDPDHPDVWQNCDFCWFQFRKVCEYVALSIALAHHEDTGLDDLSKWRPKDLLSQTSSLSGHPTQIPLDIHILADGNSRQFVPLAKPVNPAEISKIYGQCSELLHVGSLDRMLKNKMPSYDILTAEKWLAGFNRLLRNHALFLPMIKNVLICRSNFVEPAQFFQLETNGEAMFNAGDLPKFELVMA